MELLGLVLIPDTSLQSLLLLGLLGAFVALDDVSLAQTWFGQPLMAALLAGFACGDPVTGLAVGLPLQLVLAGNLPVGQSFTGDPGPASVAVVAGVCLSGYSFQPALLQISSDHLSLLGWTLLVAGAFSSLGHPIIQAERKANGLLMLQGHKTLRDGSLVRMEALHLRCLVTTFLRGFSLVLIFLLLVMKLWLPLHAYLPERLQLAAGMLPILLPGLGLGTIIERYGLGRSWPWLLGGMGLALAGGLVGGVV
jgi:mannose/fructose/N-acetylgalactosamine-specific phosphotransferase system component IIC